MSGKNDSRLKGNPAAKRMGNARLKARRAESWARGQEKKAKNRAENEARHQANLAKKNSV